MQVTIGIWTSIVYQQHFTTSFLKNGEVLNSSTNRILLQTNNSSLSNAAIYTVPTWYYGPLLETNPGMWATDVCPSARCGRDPLRVFLLQLSVFFPCEQEGGREVNRA